MSNQRIVYLNGDFVPYEQAKVSVMDRGFLFADGSYEVLAVLAGHPVDHEAHLARLDRSLREIGIHNPHSIAGWRALQGDLISRNRLTEGLLYLQVTRGVFERDFACPPVGIPPTVMMFTQPKVINANPLAAVGVEVITVPDLRWKRRDIKSVALLAQVISRQQATAAGVAEAWMCEDGAVTEGTSCTAFIVVGNRIVTRPLSTALLPSITRLAVMRLAVEEGLIVEERLFSVEEAEAADEAFHTSASALVMPVVRINGNLIGSGVPGRLTKRLRELYLAMALADTIPAQAQHSCPPSSDASHSIIDFIEEMRSNRGLGQVG